MDCPVCGCDVAVEKERILVKCPVCETIWLVSSPDHLDRILVGAEG